MGNVEQINTSMSDQRHTGAAAGSSESDPLAEGFCHSLLAGLLGMIAGGWRVRLARTAVSTREEFLAGVEERSCCYALRDSGTPAAEPILAEFTPPIAFPILNCLLGGTSEDAFLPRRPLTMIERRLLRRVAEAVGQALSAALPQMIPGPLTAEALESEYGGIERTQASGLVAGGAASAKNCEGTEAQMLVAGFELALDRQQGVMRLCLCPGLLPATATPSPAVRQSPLEISAALGEVRIEAQDLSQLTVGDILTTDAGADGEVIIRVAGIPKFIGRLGTCNGRRAVTIVRKL